MEQLNLIKLWPGFYPSHGEFLKETFIAASSVSVLPWRLYASIINKKYFLKFKQDIQGPISLKLKNNLINAEENIIHK
jgi:hypothetical protein